MFYLVIIPRWWETIADACLLQSLLPDEQGLGILQAKQHARPLSVARVLPGVHRGSLDHYIALFHRVLLAAVQDRHYAALHDNPVVQTLRTVHHALWRESQKQWVLSHQGRGPVEYCFPWGLGTGLA